MMFSRKITGIVSRLWLNNCLSAKPEAIEDIFQSGDAFRRAF